MLFPGEPSFQNTTVVDEINFKWPSMLMKRVDWPWDSLMGFLFVSGHWIHNRRPPLIGPAAALLPACVKGAGAEQGRDAGIQAAKKEGLNMYTLLS